MKTIDGSITLMKHLKRGREFESLAEELLNRKKEFVLWGAANIGQKIYEIYHEEINIIGIVDKDENKTGKLISNLLIETPDVLDAARDYIVIVTTSALDSVHFELEKKGFQKNINYIDYMFFVKIFELYKYNRLFSERIDISLTEKCTLKCKKCNMFMTYFKDPSEQPFEQVKRDIDLYFKTVDFVYGLNLLGGEPFLYSELDKILKYIGENYRNRIHKIEIFTNGMLFPDDKVLESLKKYNVIIQISDYTDRVDYKKRKEDLTGLLEKHDIQYKVLRSDEWGDFGFPENPNDLMNEEQLTHFFNRCRAPFRGLYRKKVYFCHLETSAVRAGLFPDHKNDSFDLQGEYSDKKISFLEFDEGYCEKGYITFCAKCRGCSCVNDLTVVSAEQC